MPDQPTTRDYPRATLSLIGDGWDGKSYDLEGVTLEVAADGSLIGVSGRPDPDPAQRLQLSGDWAVSFTVRDCPGGHGAVAIHVHMKPLDRESYPIPPTPVVVQDVKVRPWRP